VEGIPEYVTDTSPIGSQRRCDTLRQQSRCVVKTFENALSRPVDVCVIIEDHVDETHAEHGGAAHVFHFRKPLEICDQGIGDLVFDDLGTASHPFGEEDRKSTRLNSSHVKISYAVFCLKKK